MKIKSLLLIAVTMLVLSSCGSDRKTNDNDSTMADSSAMDSSAVDSTSVPVDSAANTDSTSTTPQQ
jgi:PBP1b-binding outer membrane lipoprotein LpoB